MLDLSAYPLCAKRLQFQRAKLEETGFNHYWAAACVADDFKDRELTAFGGLDFDDRSPENGLKLLSRLEQLIAQRLASAKKAENSAAFERRQKAASEAVLASVKSYLGVQGIKCSKITSDEQYWDIAAILWPSDIVKGEDTSIQELGRQLAGMTKQQRRSARDNLRNVPAHLRSTAPVHERKAA